MTQLTEHFSFAELTDSDTATRLGIANLPDYATLSNLHFLAAGLEKVREALGDVPIAISSGYRSPALNAAIKGAPSSAHIRGLAADFRAPAFGSPVAVAKALAPLVAELKIDQLICEGTWVHVAFAEHWERPRGNVLTAHFDGGGVRYTAGLS